MSLLPAVGTVYGSLNHFKLNMLQRAEEHNFNLSVRGGVKGSAMTLGCPLRVQGKPCNFKIQGTVSNRGVRISKLSGTHSCSAEERASKREQSQDSLRARILQLQEDIADEGEASSGREDDSEYGNRRSSKEASKRRNSSPLTSLHDSSDNNDEAHLSESNSVQESGNRRFVRERNSKHRSFDHFDQPDHALNCAPHQSIRRASHDVRLIPLKTERLDLTLDSQNEKYNRPNVSPIKAPLYSQSSSALIHSPGPISRIQFTSADANEPSQVGNRSRHSPGFYNSVDIRNVARPVDSVDYGGFADSASSSPIPETSTVPSSLRTLAVPAPRHPPSVAYVPAPLEQETLMLPPRFKKRKISTVPANSDSRPSVPLSRTPSLLSRLSGALRYLWPGRLHSFKRSHAEIPSPLPLAHSASQDHLQSAISLPRDLSFDWSSSSQQIAYSTSNFVSFLRRFGVTEFESTIASLRSTGIDSLETLILVGSMEKVVIDALAERMCEKNGELIRQVGEGIRSCLNGDES